MTEEQKPTTPQEPPVPEQRFQVAPAVPKKQSFFGSFANRFVFETALELRYDQLVAGFREYLGAYKPEDIHDMVSNNIFPFIHPEHIAGVRGLEKYLSHINVDRLAKFLADARPDLMQAIMAEGPANGYRYLVNLREHLLRLVESPEEAAAQPMPALQSPPKEMVKAVCDKCGKDWPVAKEDFDKIEKCPFCGAG